MKYKTFVMAATAVIMLHDGIFAAEDFPRPYSPPCVERENVFEFTAKPRCQYLGDDKYEITFAVKGFCDVTVGIVDPDPAKELVQGRGVVVRHLASGVLGANAPPPFQKNSLKQTILWDGKDDLGAYPREPDKLSVQVRLGLKPEFDKRLGGVSPYNIPGKVWGMAADKDGVYVMSYGVRFYIRHFDHEGKYVRSLTPPSGTLPEPKLGGRGFIEYEKGKRAIFAPQVYAVTASDGDYLPFAGRIHEHMQVAAANGKIYYSTSGTSRNLPPVALHWLGTDGSSDTTGLAGRPYAPNRMFGGRNGSMFMTSSPDGKWLYLTDGNTDGRIASYCVWRCSADGSENAEVFAGKSVGSGSKASFAPGSAAGEFNCPAGMDCDALGRLYVCDALNGRLQIFSPEGKFLKQMSIERPQLVQVHKKTGAIYVHHTGRIQGRSAERVTKLTSFDDPNPVGGFERRATCMALDSWAVTPTLWLGGGSDGVNSALSVTVWQDKGVEFEKTLDFDEEARTEAGDGFFGRWFGEGSKLEKIAADPVREQVYYCNRFVFDLRSGKLSHLASLGGTDDIAFDKRGYMHRHFNPGFYFPGVGRVDPDQATPGGRKPSHLPRVNMLAFKEVPYDYGIEKKDWLGVLPVRDQPGAKFFQDGIGVNMAGDVAENCNIYYVPKMDDDAKSFMLAGNPKANPDARAISDADENNTAAFVRNVEEMLKRGEEVYYIRRQPGISLMGATIWTFDANGELRQESAVITGGLINGVQMDEDGKLYFVNNRTKFIANRAFLDGQGGKFGVAEDKRNRNIGFHSGPFTGTLFKTAAKDVKVLALKAPVRMDQPPDRPAELGGIYGEDSRCWVEGAEWLYAGASPIVQGGCSCPTMRFHTDWHKRTFVPEAYRHSIGILDANGNLIMHLGRYGKFDDVPRTPADQTINDVSLSFVNVVAGTDNYLCFPDHGERLVVMKLNYHATEIAPLRMK
jgi:sugar lactone lactonase YvrE